MYVCDMSVNKLYVYKKYINKKISNINIYTYVCNIIRNFKNKREYICDVLECKI